MENGKMESGKKGYQLFQKGMIRLPRKSLLIKLMENNALALSFTFLQ